MFFLLYICIIQYIRGFRHSRTCPASPW